MAEIGATISSIKTARETFTVAKPRLSTYEGRSTLSTYTPNNIGN
jgi:hypothetical protein